MDLETRRKRQKALIGRMVKRKVRERAQRLYEERGQEAGHDLKDWFQAEKEVLANKSIGNLYRKLVSGARLHQQNPDFDSAAEEPAACESPA